jgi:enamine deaminase RidA (YjgF/YER057c/UK114 family)
VLRQSYKPAGLSLPHAAQAAYDYAVRAGDMVYISGQVARDANGAPVGVGDFEAQAVQVFENLKIVLASAGGTLADVVDTRMYILDRANRVTLNEVRRRYYPGPDFPCSTLLIVAGLAHPDLLLEIEAVAYIPAKR